MSTFKLSAPIKLKPKDSGARSSIDPNEIFETICDQWDELQQEFRKLEDQEIN